MTPQKVIIIGGGFAGIQTALDLSKKHKGSNLEIILISDRDHFEYYPALHGYLSINGPVPYHMLPLADIFSNSSVTLVIEKVTACDLATKMVTLESGNTVSGDYLVLALGAQSTFFGIEG